MVSIPDSERNQSEVNREEAKALLNDGVGEGQKFENKNKRETVVNIMDRQVDKSQEERKEAIELSYGSQITQVGKATIVAMSPTVNTDIINKCLNLGVALVLQKPVQQSDLSKLS